MTRLPHSETIDTRIIYQIGENRFSAVSITLDEAIEMYVTYLVGANRSPQTIGWYKFMLRSLTRFINGSMPIEAITIADLRKWQESLASKQEIYTEHPTRPSKSKQLSVYSLHGYVRTVRIFFRWLFEEGHLPKSPAARLELPKLPRGGFKGMNEGDMRKIINSTKSNARDNALVLFLADTYCRVGGLVALKIADLDLNTGYATVHEKGLETRTVYMRAITVKAMRKWLRERPKVDHDYVFVSTSSNSTFGKQMTGSGVYELITRLAANAGVEGRSGPHQWRHGGARAMIQRGAPLSVVAELLGHADVGTTWRFYSSLGSERLKVEHKKYSWM